jgi:hypothetical protein
MKTPRILVLIVLFILSFGSMTFFALQSNAQTSIAREYVITQYAHDGSVIQSWISGGAGSVDGTSFLFQTRDNKHVRINGTYSVVQTR